MMLKTAPLMLALSALIAAPVLAQTAATVNGKVIPASRIDLIVKQEVSQGKQTDTPQLREAIKKELIRREVLIQEAEKQKFGARPEVIAALENARQSTIINAMLADYLRKNPMKDSDVKVEYDRFKTELGDKEYHARHILVATEDEAKSVITKIKGGAKFEDLAKTLSKDGSGANGGDLNWASPNSFVPEFGKALMAMPKGALSETPVKTPYGFHVIRVDDIRAAKVPTMEEFKQQYGEQLQQRKLQGFRDELMKKAKIQ